MTERVIHTKTQEEFDKVLELFEKKGWKRFSGKEIDLFNDKAWSVYEDKTCLDYKNNIPYCYLDHFKGEGYEIITFQQFLQEEGLVEEEFKPGEEVCMIDEEEKVHYGYYVGKLRDGKFVVEREDGIGVYWAEVEKLKRKDMTKEQIEKKLGYRINIVTEE